MGLGKTPIAIAVAEELLGIGDIDLCMVVVPGSLRVQWARKIAEFTDVPTRTIKRKGETLIVPAESSCVIIDGTPKRKEKLWRYVRQQRPDYVICSYESVVRDRLARRISPGLVILDEATAIKTLGADRTLKIKEFLQPEYRLALSGTAVENRADELFSIMEWVDADVLGDPEKFDTTYCNRDDLGRPDYRHLDVLHDIMRPAMSRKKRTDADVAPYLPTVDHDTWWLDEDPALARAYADMAEELLIQLKMQRFAAGFDLRAYYSGAKIDADSAMGKIMSIYQCMEMLLDHPRLVMDSALNYEDPSSPLGSRYAHLRMEDGLFDGLKTSPKLELLKDKVPQILDDNDKNKVLIFSQYRGMQPIISKALGVPYVYYNGDMSNSAKVAAVSRFERDPTCNVFISSHAGAYGTDMYMASHLINYDLPWSAGKADQINARHVRVASEFKQVFVRDMLLRGSLDHWKHELLESKRDLAAQIMDGKKSAQPALIRSLTQALQSMA